MVAVRSWLSRNSTGGIIGALIAGIAALPTIGFLAMTLGSSVGAGWLGTIAGTAGAVVGLIIGYAIVFVIGLAAVCTVGGLLGAMIEALVRVLLGRRSPRA